MKRTACYIIITLFLLFNTQSLTASVSNRVTAYYYPDLPFHGRYELPGGSETAAKTLHHTTNEIMIFNK
jgi:hypothetical protein